MYKFLLGLVGMAAFTLFAPVSSIYDGCLRGAAAVYPDVCWRNFFVPMITSGLIGLVGGLVVGAIADNVLARKPQNSDEQTKVKTIATPVPQVVGKQCHRCGSKTLPEFKFCIVCGAPLKTKCSKCGEINDGEYKFCGVCGTPLTIPQVQH